MNIISYQWRELRNGMKFIKYRYWIKNLYHIGVRLKALIRTQTTGYTEVRVKAMDFSNGS